MEKVGLVRTGPMPPSSIQISEWVRRDWDMFCSDPDLNEM